MDEDPWFQISRFLSSRREMLGMSRDALAKKLDVTRATIYNWESGRRIPVERLANLAVALEVDHDELLRLHPEVPKAQGFEAPEPKDRRQVVGVSVAALVLAAMAFTWFTAASDCLAIAAGMPSLIDMYEETFEYHGGEVVMGCPNTIAEKWGPGHIQQFLGGSTGNSAIMRLDGADDAFVMAGPFYWDYVSIAGGGTPDLVGFPVSHPLLCGESVVIILAKGLNGPGAMVTTADRSDVAWIPASIWAVYAEHGGPMGPLGSPTEKLVRSDTSETVTFDNGTIEFVYGTAPTVTPPPVDVEPFSPDLCTEAVLADVAPSEMRVDKPERRVEIP